MKRPGKTPIVAICDYYSGRHFEDVVMKAVFDACRAKGLDAGVKTEFKEAERQLAEWEKKGGQTYCAYERDHILPI